MLLPTVMGMSRSYMQIVGLVSLSLVAGGCSAASSAAPPEPTVVLRVSGSGSATPIVEQLAAVFTASHPEVSFEFGSGTNTGGGVTGVAAGTLDLGVANRPLKPEEAALGVGYHAFATDAIVFAVRLPNQVLSVTTDQVRSLYGGEITDWSRLGGDPLPVFLLGRDPDESAIKSFFEPIMYGQSTAPAMAVLERSSEMLSALDSTPGSIGFTSLGLLRLSDYHSVAPLIFDGVEPGPATITDGTYRWVTSFALITPPGGASDAAAEFLEFVLSTGARSTLEEYAYAPVAG